MRKRQKGKTENEMNEANKRRENGIIWSIAEGGRPKSQRNSTCFERQQFYNDGSTSGKTSLRKFVENLVACSYALSKPELPP